MFLNTTVTMMLMRNCHGQCHIQSIEGDMVLCQVNAPLIEKCFAMIADGKPAYVLGRDIGTSLKTLVKKIKTPRICQ